MTSIVFYDDARARSFEPFASSRPACELRAGALLTRERWCAVLQGTAAGFVSSPWLADFAEADAAPAFDKHAEITAGQWVVNSRALPHLGAATHVISSHTVLQVDGHVAAVRLSRTMRAEELADGNLTLDDVVATQENNARTADVAGVWLHDVWDLIGSLTALLNDDIPRLARTLSCETLAANAHPQVALLGNHPVWTDASATIEPFVTFDTQAGPVLIRRGAQVQSFTRIVGPCVVGDQSTVMADRIANCSIGPICRVHGEVSSSIFLGYANKGHDGFVGHSIIGRWVNLGAGTITSNLKNTYGAVALWTPDGIRWTGQQFLGTLFGDHVKTGIGLRLTTGCVLGVGANVFDAMPPKMVRPFRWGGGPAAYVSFDREKFLAIATRMMQRRNVVLDERMRACLIAVYEHAAHDARWEQS